MHRGRPPGWLKILLFMTRGGRWKEKASYPTVHWSVEQWAAAASDLAWIRAGVQMWLSGLHHNVLSWEWAWHQVEERVGPSSKDRYSDGMKGNPSAVIWWNQEQRKGLLTESKLPKKIFFSPLFNRFLTFTSNYVAALM